MRLLDALKIAKTELKDIDTASKECIWLFAKILDRTTASITADDLCEIDDFVFDNFLQKRKERIPFEYIVNEAGFYGFDFYVDERCLIPRPETELLIDIAAKIASDINATTLLDICTGSGAIACTLKKIMPQIQVSASDISADALSVAKINAKKLNVDINFLLSDLFLNIKDDSFDILTANPPYIQNSYVLEKNVLYEPHNALFGGEDGVEIVKSAIEGFFERNFKAFICEIGFDQKEKVINILQKKPNSQYGFYKDYAGFDRGFWVIKE
jgi:release factor glutamine methyltransferase